MPTPTFQPPQGDQSTAQIQDWIVKLVRDLNYLLSNLDTVNINRLDAKVIIAQSITALQIMANSITADKMNVAELSAIAANLGTITAGIINAVTINGATINAATINIQDDVTIGNNLSVGFGSNNRRITIGGGFITYVGGTLTIDGAFSDVVINSASTITIKSLTDDINLITNTTVGKHVYANTILLA